MSGSAGFIYSSAIEKYSFGPDHPFNSQRLILTLDLLLKSGILTQEEWIKPEPATMEQLLLAHDAAYIDAVRHLSTEVDKTSLVHGLGSEDTPVFKDMHQASSLIVGGSILAAKLVMDGYLTHAVNLAGGLHHAMRSKASGFCIYNDPVAAIAFIRQKYGARVAYIDIDAHHGDGVQAAFYDDPHVLTISIHETGRYLFPGTGTVQDKGVGEGYGYTVNLPMDAFTEDDSWLKSFAAVVPVITEYFRPDIIVTTNGCDTHTLDPLTHLCCTTRSFATAQHITHKLAHNLCEGRLVAFGGGGYDWWNVVPRAWSLLWSEFSGRTLPERLPDSWVEAWRASAGTELIPTFLDDINQFPPIPRRDEIEEKNELTVRRVLQEYTYRFNKS